MSGAGIQQIEGAQAVEVLVVPGPLALLPPYAGERDPLADLRSACRAGVADLLASGSGPVHLLAAEPSAVDRRRGVTDPAGLRVARALLAEADVVATAEHTVGPRSPDAGPVTRPPTGTRLLVVADGSARRGERAPGHLDPRAAPFDALVEQALAVGDRASLAGLDLRLAEELLASGAPVLARLAGQVADPGWARLRWAGDPFGVRYWVVRWGPGGGS